VHRSLIGEEIAGFLWQFCGALCAPASDLVAAAALLQTLPASGALRLLWSCVDEQRQRLSTERLRAPRIVAKFDCFRPVRRKNRSVDEI